MFLVYTFDIVYVKNVKIYVLLFCCCTMLESNNWKVEFTTSFSHFNTQKGFFIIQMLGWYYCHNHLRLVTLSHLMIMLYPSYIQRQSMTFSHISNISMRVVKHLFLSHYLSLQFSTFCPYLNECCLQKSPISLLDPKFYLLFC